MKKINAILIVTLLLAGTLQAGAGWIDTERFGYSGTITRYADAEMTSQVGEAIQTGPRDVCIWSDPSYPGSAVLGSWWYSTATDDQGNPRGSGWGNHNGNTGPGFMQYYDTNQDYVTSQQYAFSNFDGTYWTDFSFSLSAAMTEAGASSRLSAPSNTGDAGYFQLLNVNLTATGLQGQLDGGMIVAEEADAFAAGVIGTISGVFVNTSTSQPANNGYYAFTFDLNMDNWAYENRDLLVGQYDTFYIGSFAAIPEPATMILLGLGGLLCRKFRKA